MYNALTEIVYRMPLDKCRSDFEYEVSTSPMHFNVEQNKDSPNERESEVRLEPRSDFINMFLLEKSHGQRVSVPQPNDRVCPPPEGTIALYEKPFKFGF